MAYLKQMKQKEVNFQRKGEVHKEATADYQIIELEDGKSILQINTYGTSNRKNPTQQSQVIQLDKTMVLRLATLVEKYHIA